MLHVLYFSPTRNTFSLLQTLVAALPKQPVQWHPYTTPADRDKPLLLHPSDILIWGSPVYAGKLPNKTLPWLKDHLRGCGNPTVLLCSFGNRNFDNTLAEMQSIAVAAGLRPVAAAAMVAEHAFDSAIGAGRPTAADVEALQHWAQRIRFGSTDPLHLPGSASAPYYQPLREDGTPALFLKAQPEIASDRCNGCGACAELCPMGSLTMTETRIAACQGVCIKCMACVKGCPQQAIALPPPDLLSHISMLRTHSQHPQPNAFFPSL